MKKTFALLFAMTILFSAAKAQEGKTILLWPNDMPNTNGVDHEPFDDSRRNFRPEMHAFIPDGDSLKRAVVILPGGGYAHLAVNHEGYDWAPFFNERNIAVFVVKYRMPHANSQVPESDVLQAVKMIRENASGWKIDPLKIGIMGFSAGGHLATTMATHFPELKLDFQILFYPVVSMGDSITHKGSKNNLLGTEASLEKTVEFSNDLRVNPATPRALLLLTDDDKTVLPANSLNYYMGLKRNKIPAVMHVYASGGHGFGIRENFRYHKPMMEAISEWLSEL